MTVNLLRNTFNLLTNLEEIKLNHLAKYLKLLITKTQKRRVGQARGPARSDRQRPEPGPSAIGLRARAGLATSTGMYWVIIMGNNVLN